MKNFHDVNRIRICIKTNGHIVKFQLNTKNFTESESYQVKL